MEPEVSLLQLQMRATSPYPEPARPSPYPYIPLPEDYLCTLLNIKADTTYSFALYVKIMFTLEQPTKTHKESRVIALLIL